MKNIIMSSLLFLFGVCQSFANIDMKELKLLEKQAQDYVKIYEKEAELHLDKSQVLINKSGIDKTGFMKRQQDLLEQSYKGAGVKKNHSQELLVFISFSMPEKAIIELLQTSADNNATLLIQGLIDNSMPKTLNKIADLVKKAGNNGGIQVDPNLFRQYQIQVVPAYVLRLNNDDFNIVYGLSSIQQALSVFKNKVGQNV